MDIHAPHEPVRGWKEFAVHIAIVTVGILIALALEGLREVIRDHRLVAETRVNFRRELAVDRDHAARELPRVQALAKLYAGLASAAPGAGANTDAVRTQLAANRNPFYFFALTSWQTALSTGALQHMAPDEVEQYAGASETVRVYSNLQNETLRAENSATAFFQAHPHPDAAAQGEGVERLLLLARTESTLAFVGQQLKEQLDTAYGASQR